MPRTRPIELPVALLLATAAFAFSVAGACAILLAGLVVVAGHAEVVLPAGTPTWCAGAALGCANVAGLIALTRPLGGLDPRALAAAWCLGLAVPVSGAPVPAALLAAAGTGLAVRLGTRSAPAPRAMPLACGLAAAALALLVVAFDGADAKPAPPRAAVAASLPAAKANALPVRRVTRVPPARPADAVRAYYRALDDRRFARAWRRLSPPVRAEFGGFAQWRAGFAATLASRPIDVRIDGDGGARTVTHVLEARDRVACGVLVRRFAVRWRLTRTPAGWRATALTATPAAPARCVSG